MNTDTPRTDVEEYVEVWEKKSVVSAFFARQLERELNEAKAKLVIESMTEKCTQCNHAWNPSLVESGWCIFCIQKETAERRDQLRAELEKSNQLVERLRCDLADPPLDVQEIVIKKLHLVSEDELEKVRAELEKVKLASFSQFSQIEALKLEVVQEHLMAQELCAVLDAILPLSPAVIKFQKIEKEK